MTSQERKEYLETRAHWQALLEAVGMVRVRDAYMDALLANCIGFMVTPTQLRAIRDVITENGGEAP